MKSPTQEKSGEFLINVCTNTQKTEKVIIRLVLL